MGFLSSLGSDLGSVLSSVGTDVSAFLDPALSAVGPIAGAVTGAGASGGSSLLGGLLSGSGLGSLAGAGLSYLGTSNTNAASAANVQQQEQYATQMSDTAYQRATADMKAAGLNPMLAYSQGGASSPTGSVAPVQNKLASAAAGVSNAVAAQAAVENTKADTVQKVASAQKMDAEAQTESFRPGLLQDQADQIISETARNNKMLDNLDASTKEMVSRRYLLDAQQKEVLAKTILDQQKAAEGKVASDFWSSDKGPAQYILDRSGSGWAGNTLSTANSIFNMMRSGGPYSNAARSSAATSDAQKNFYNPEGGW